MYVHVCIMSVCACSCVLCLCVIACMGVLLLQEQEIQEVDGYVSMEKKQTEDDHAYQELSEFRG